MSLLDTIIEKIKRLRTPSPTLGVAVADDGSGSSIEPGESSVLRADPTTGAILVKDISGGGGGGGTGGATEETLSALNDKVPEPTTTDLAGDASSIPVRVVTGGGIPVTVQNPPPTASAIPGASDAATVTRIVPTGSQPESGSVAVIISTDQPSFGVAAEATLRTRTVGASVGVFVSAESVSPDIHALHTVAVGGATLEAQTDGSQRSKITNGLDDAEVLSADPSGGEPGLVTRNIPSGTQPVSGPLTNAELRASAVPVSIAAGAATIGKVDQGVGGASAWKVDGSGVTLTVADGGGSLTVDDGGSSLTTDTAQLPNALVGGRLDVNVGVSALPSGASTSALQGAGLPAAFTAGGGVKTGLVDALPAGANAIGSVSVSSLPGSPAQEHVTAASPHAARLSDGSAFYKGAVAGDNLGADIRVSSAAVSNANPVPVADAGGSLTVDGTVTETNSSTIATNTGRIPAQGQALASASTPVVLPLAQAAGALALQSQLPAALGAGGGVKIDGSGTPVPVNGTVTANIGTSGSLALAATQTDGTQKAIARGGAKGATVAADITNTAEGTDHQALDVQIYHGGAAKDPTQIRALTGSDVVTANIGTSGALALDATLTGGTQIAIAKGPVSPGAAVGVEKPVLVGGSDGTNAQTINVDANGAVRLQSSGLAGSAAPTRTMQVGGSDGTNLRALKTDASGRPDVTVASGNITADTELAAPATLSDQTSNPTVTSVGTFPSNWDPANAQWNRAQGLANGAQVVALDRSHLGPFGQIIAQPATFISQVTFTYGINTILGTTAASGTGATVDTNAGLLRVQCGTNNAGNASYQVNRPLLYRAGQGMGSIWSAAFTAGLANNTSIAGPSTTAANADGYFFGYKGTSFGIHHYRSGSEVSFTAQASWNGTIPTGFDPTKLNLYDVRYPFLGAGDIFFFIADAATGRLFLVHTIRYANSSTSLQISNPTLRFLARSVNTGNTTNLTILVGSVAAYIVGARHFSGPPFVFNNQKAVTGGAETNVFSARVATTLNGVTNRGAARIRLSTAVGDNGNTITAFLIRNGATLGGSPAFSPYGGSTADNGVTLTNATSMLSFDTAGTTSAGGTPMLNTGCARNAVVPFDLSELDLIMLPGETWTFAANPGANSNCAYFVNGIEEW